MRAQQLDMAEKARLGFMEFVLLAWPEFINGRHHKIMADKFNKLAAGKSINTLSKTVLAIGLEKKTSHGNCQRMIYSRYVH